MSKNVLILSGSPRKDGNSDILCDEFMRGAQEAGHTAEQGAVSLGGGCFAIQKTALRLYKPECLR